MVLDRNKIKSIGEISFVSQRRLQELHIEENRLRSLANISMLENLHRLYVGMNRIQVGEVTDHEPVVLLGRFCTRLTLFVKGEFAADRTVYRNSL